MNELVLWELRYVGEAFLLGAILMFAYDILRIIRIILPHSLVLISLEDVTYWAVAGVILFLLLYKEDEGSIRWFAVAFASLGMLVYNFGISRFAVPFVGKCISFTGKKVSVLLKKPLIRIKMKTAKKNKTKIKRMD